MPVNEVTVSGSISKIRNIIGNAEVPIKIDGRYENAKMLIGSSSIPERVEVEVDRYSIGIGDIMFYDYDGALVYAYNVEDFLNLTELPPNPTHSGLTAQGWNWPLDEAKSYAANHGKLVVGQTYITDNGKTRLYISIDPNTPEDRRNFTVRFLSSDTNNVTINWGDGTTELVGSTALSDYSHTYENAGDYVIELTVNTGTISFGGDDTHSIYGSQSASNHRAMIYKVELGNNVTSLDGYVFNYCRCLKTITIPIGITFSGSYNFGKCSSLKCIIFPTGLNYIGGDHVFDNCYGLEVASLPSTLRGSDTSNYVFYLCPNLRILTLPERMGIISGYFAAYCSSLETITISKSATQIDGYAFRGCRSLKNLDIPENIYVYENYVFADCASLEYIPLSQRPTRVYVAMFEGCESLKSITIPPNTIDILSNAFTRCLSLTTITIPSKVTKIYSSAFMTCTGLSEMHFKPTTPPEVVNANAFSGLSIDCKIYVPAGTIETYKSATNYPSSETYQYIEE